MQASINQPNAQEVEKNSYQNYPSAPPAPPVPSSFSDNNFIINLEEDLIDSYIGWSILNNACCLCTGVLILFCSIPALTFSLKTNDYLKSGNLVEARLNSRYAYYFNFAGALFLLMISILVTLYLVVGFEFKKQTDSLNFSKYFY